MNHLVILAAILGAAVAVETDTITCFDDVFGQDNCNGQDPQQCKFSPKKNIFKGSKEYERKLAKIYSQLDI